MPFVFAIIGIALVVSGVRGTSTQLIGLVKSDLTGHPSYLSWMIGIGIVGAVGYVDELRTISRMFMVIILIGLLWSNRGFFADFTQQTSSTPQPSTATATGNQTTTQSLPSLPALPSLSSLANSLAL